MIFSLISIQQGSGKLEKAEILELTVEYLKALQGRLAEKQEKEIKPEGGLHNSFNTFETNFLVLKSLITVSIRYRDNHNERSQRL